MAGHAAYQRGSALLSRQIDRELEERRRQRMVRIDAEDIREMEDEITRLRERIAELERDCKRAVRIIRTMELDRSERRKRIKRMRERARSAERAMLMYRRRWQYVSRILRLLPSDQVRRARAIDAEVEETDR